MGKPIHPGKIVRQKVIAENGMSVTAFAKAIGVGRPAVSNLLNGKAAISPEMAVRLSMALNTSSKMWIIGQAMYDLYKAEKKRNNLKVKQIFKEMEKNLEGK